MADDVPLPSQDDDWTGPDDPDCPHNWPMWKRIYMTSILAFLCMNVSFASLVYAPGARDVWERFGVSHTASLLDLSPFLWALGLGAIIAGFFGSAVVSVGGGTNAGLWQPALAGFVYPYRLDQQPIYDVGVATVRSC